MLGHKLLGNFSKLLTRFGQSFNFEVILYIKAIFCSNREPLLVYFSTTLSRNASYITSFDIFYQIIGSNQLLFIWVFYSLFYSKTQNLVVSGRTEHDSKWRTLVILARSGAVRFESSVQEHRPIAKVKRFLVKLVDVIDLYVFSYNKIAIKL